MSKYMTELFYGKPEPVWVINQRRRGLGTEPYYDPSSSGGYGSRPAEFGPYSRGPLLPDVQIKAPLYDMQDVARIKDVLGVEGVYNVVCDIPEKTITVSSSLSPRTIVSLVRRVMGTAQIINIIEPPYPVQPAYLPPLDRTRYSSYDDMYSYDGQGRQPGYSSSYANPYNGRSYDNEFRPARYSNYREY
jgi:hypothetical protein